MSSLPPDAERRLAAIMAADVEGYSKLISQDDVAAMRMLAERRRAANGLIARFRGRVVDNAGDSTLAEFQSAVDAVQCAIAIQAALAELNDAVTPEMRMRLRIGIHLGDLLVKGSELFGNGVNVAARLQALAEPGGICVSDAVRMAAGNEQAVDYKLLGDQSLKNIAEPVRVHRVRARPGVPIQLPSLGPRLRARNHARVSISRMPVTGSLLLGRDEELRALDDGWNDPSCRIISLVAWGGVGKSTLVNHWLRRMARDGFRGASNVYAWSFYHQGTVDRVTAADEFIGSSLAWFGESDVQRGSARQKGERLAKLVQQERTLLILDGLETLQRPPGEKEGSVVDDGLHTLLCELGSVNPGLCLVTTRFPVTDLQDFQDSHQQLDLECLRPVDGANLLRAYNIAGSGHELKSASEEFGGHCLALTLLANYLKDAFDGDIAERHQIEALQDDVRLGGHARRVLSSYVNWIDDAAELEILRCIGLFDRPATPASFDALKAAAIPSLTAEVCHVPPNELNRIVSRLRRAGLLAEQDPTSPRTLDAHPLVRQFFRDQLKNELQSTWKLGNACLFHHFRFVAPKLPDAIAEMNELFQAVIFGCRAGLHRQTFREVYLPRIMRGEQLYAANALGARGTLLLVLSHFFVDHSWERLVEPSSEQEGLEPQDQLIVLQHVRMLLTATLGYNDPSATQCTQRLKVLCDEHLGGSRSLYAVFTSNWMHALVSEPMENALRHAKDILSLAQKESDAAMMIGAYRSLCDTTYFMGSFARARDYADRGVAIWEAQGPTTIIGEISIPVVTCVSFAALALWQLGDAEGAFADIEKAISMAEGLAHAHSIAVALHFDGYISHFCGLPFRAEQTARRLIELSQQNGFRFWLAGAHVQLGWARTSLGSHGEGLSLISDGLRMWRATNAELIVPYWLAMSAQAHAAAGRDAACLDMLDAGCRSADARGELWWKAELLRLKGQHLVEQGLRNLGVQCLRQALELAGTQGSLSLQLRAAVEIARVLVVEGGQAAARTLVAPLYEAIDHGLDTGDLKAARSVLSTPN